MLSLMANIFNAWKARNVIFVYITIKKGTKDLNTIQLILIRAICDLFYYSSIFLFPII